MIKKNNSFETVPTGSCLLVARFLAHLRFSGRGIPVNAAEALLLIAAGIDHTAELQQAMTDEKGRPQSMATTTRVVNLLRGRARYARGKWIESPFSLIAIRKHPHRKGYQLLLSQQGHQLVCALLGGGQLDHQPTPEQVEPTPD